MMEITYDNALKAMRKAHEKGDVDAAKRMAGLANSLKPKGPDVMGQVNAGIGDVIDFINPFDTNAVSQALGMGDRLSTGSAADAMNAVGINAAQDAPEGFVEGLARGGGNAAASGPVAGLTLAGLRGAGGAIGAAADDAFQALNTLKGYLAETGAGAVSRGAEEAVEQAGGGEVAQAAASLAAPLAAPVAAASAVAAGRSAQNVPVVSAASNLVRDVRKNLTPMTEGGAREVARERLQDLAGGETRAAELARSVSPQNEFGLTGAEQTGDVNLIGLQSAVKGENPVIRERLDEGGRAARQNISDATKEMGGDIADARGFFRQRQKEFANNMSARVDRVISNADADIANVGPRSSEASNSSQVVQKLKLEHNDFREENAQLWAAVPLETDISGGEAAQIARRLIDDTPRAQQEDIPATIRAALDAGNELGGPTTAKELHGLYSKLRQVARNARAGVNTNSNMARIADEIAEGILQDLDAAAPKAAPAGRAEFDTTSEAFVRVEGEGWRFVDRQTGEDVGATQQRSVAQKINKNRYIAVPEGVYMPALNAAIKRGGPDARPTGAEIEAAIAYHANRKGIEPAAAPGGADAGLDIGASIRDAIAHTRAMHETFDQGAVGRILRRTSATDEQIAPEVALDRTIGRSGNAALADNANIRNAAPSAGADIQDYLRSRFSEAIFNSSGEFSPKSAKTWLRNNREVLGQYSGLSKELYRVANNRDAAQSFSIRAQERGKLADQGPIKDFNAGQPQKAITAIIGADSPVKAAKSIAATARKDKTGKALAGVKGAFSDYLTQDVDKLPALLADKQTRSAMSQIFDVKEMRRFEQISSAMKKLTTKGRDVGPALDSRPSKLVEMFVRVAAVKNNPLGGSGIESMQLNQMASGRAKEILENLTNTKARQILTDAIEDPELFRALLSEPRALDVNERVRSKLAPYLVGTASAQSEE